MADPRFSHRGTPTIEVGVPTYYLTHFPRKLHKMKKCWPEGTSLVPPRSASGKGQSIYSRDRRGHTHSWIVFGEFISLDKLNFDENIYCDILNQDLPSTVGKGVRGGFFSTFFLVPLKHCDRMHSEARGHQWPSDHIFNKNLSNNLRKSYWLGEQRRNLECFLICVILISLHDFKCIFLIPPYRETKYRESLLQQGICTM